MICQVHISIVFDLNERLLILLSSSHLTPKLLYQAWWRRVLSCHTLKDTLGLWIYCKINYKPKSSPQKHHTLTHKKIYQERTYATVANAFYTTRISLFICHFHSHTLAGDWKMPINDLCLQCEATIYCVKSSAINWIQCENELKVTAWQ